MSRDGMTRPRLWVEPCAGSAAVALRLVGGPYANPPIGYMGGKRGYARIILGVLGLRQGQGADGVVLADAGPWAAVWRVLTSPGGADAVAGVIRAWEGEEPRALWERLRAEGWGDLTTPEEVGRWAVVNTIEGPNGIQNADDYGHDPRTGERFPWRGQEAVASRVSACARWLVCGAWAFRSGYPDSGWYDHPNAANGEKCQAVTIASRLAPLPVPVSVYNDARAIPIPADCAGVYCYIDPPYQGTTGYAHDLPRADVLDLAQRWSDAGATVAVSEAVPLDLPGWHHVRIDGERKGQKRTFSRQQAEYLTLNREPAFRPVVGQLHLLGAA